ncbi:hypothetical protein ACFP56_08210 [Paenibacillus septentrionalis]|uniref:Uncharacterized protein n=1 Tax=Paenibacillus septentrionalis TaxID=429342 RepID=A0ABW1V1G7_9BACL
MTGTVNFLFDKSFEP